MRLRPCISNKCFIVAVCVGRLVLGAEPAGLKAPAAASTELVREALHAEVGKDPAGRSAALARALAEAPLDPAAHWHSGQVRVEGQWLSVADAVAQAKADPRLIEYRQLRDQDTGTVDGQIALARWCRKQELDVQEKFHWNVVMQLSPLNKEAQARLGLQEFRGRLLTREQIDAYKQRLASAETAMKKWKPLAQKWNSAFKSTDNTEREAARAALSGVSDVEAIPALEEFLAPANADAELAVVGVLGQIDDQIATDFLVHHAVFSNDALVREAAAKALKPRSIFAYVPTLMSAIKAPIEYSYFANMAQAEGPTQIFEIGAVAPAPLVYSLRHPQSAIELQRRFDARAAVAKVRVAEQVNSANQESEALNQRIYPALALATGQQLPGRPQAWWQWWQQFNELQASQETDKQVVRAKGHLTRVIMRSCFLPGTKVWLDTGPVAIEKVRIGDRVLAQDQDTGELDFRFVVDTTIRPPSPTLRIGLPKEEIAATLGHPIWVVGKGWRMAKEIEVGDHLHGMHGGIPVEYLEKGPESNAYNLVVAEFNSYFIGDHRILVHDNMARRPTLALVPGYIPRADVAAKTEDAR